MSRPSSAVAAELAADGRCLQALADLVALNRVAPDAEVERRMVELRHAAFAELDAARPTVLAARASPTRSPAPDGLPESTRRHLTGDLLGGAIMHHGCLRVDGLVDVPTGRPASTATSSDAFDARERAGRRRGRPRPAALVRAVRARSGEGRAASPGTVRPGRRCAVAPLGARRGLRARGVTKVVTEYFDERPAMIANKWVLRRSPTRNGRHRLPPGRRLPRRGDPHGRLLDRALALRPRHRATGHGPRPAPLRRRPGWRRGATFPWSLAEAALDGVLRTCRVQPGRSRRATRCSSTSSCPTAPAWAPTSATRYAIESWFVAPSSYPAKHVPVVL